MKQRKLYGLQLSVSAMIFGVMLILIFIGIMIVKPESTIIEFASLFASTLVAGAILFGFGLLTFGLMELVPLADSRDDTEGSEDLFAEIKK